MSVTAPTCPVRDAQAEALLATHSAALRDLDADELIAVEVNLGSWEHPQWVPARYVRRAEDRRFHWVAREGRECRVHEHQFRAEFQSWLEINPFPYGRFSAPEVAR